ncbi:hypothetical protein [Geobacter sp. OR-1]|uniref:hypothetical protein n=1 Tax=Geobacter sp. OR-1 TaxID=1266765 RepID=UPI0005AA8EFF|nr:hypothetical protein [Geobacter sp. OR-1]
MQTSNQDQFVRDAKKCGFDVIYFRGIFAAKKEEYPAIVVSHGEVFITSAVCTVEMFKSGRLYYAEH